MALCPELSQQGQSQRQNDEHNKSLQKRPGTHDLCGLLAHEKPQIYGQKKHLGEKQQGRRGKNKPCVSTAEMGEDYDVVNAWGEQNEIYPE
jgi:hypothetical protein